MNRGLSVPCPSVRASWWLGGALLCGLLGCVTEQARLQSDDDNPRDRYDVKTLGDVSTVGNAQPVQVAGVGLVVGLEGTGGECPPDQYRAMLENELRRMKVKNIQELLASPTCAVVLVSAQIPPGAREGDTFDVDVTLPPRSKATSLRGGYLQECLLYNYDSTRHLSPEFDGPDVGLKGHALVKAEGLLLVGFGDGDESARVKRGRIWGGGKTRIDLPYLLLANRDQQYARVTAQVADRINETFQGGFRSAGAVATAKNNLAVELRVPAAYRLNQPRFLRVARLVPMSPGHRPRKEGDQARPYAQQLADDLLDPTRTVTAALRLEALGQSSIPALKAGLNSSHQLVRFCSAESLAYLGSPSCGEELAAVVQKQAFLRAFALTALASLDEAVSQIKLQELLYLPLDDEVRYGAFRALRALNDRNPELGGELLNEAYWLHQVAPGTAPLVHLTSQRRAEIVVFGEKPFLRPPFSFLAGEFAITAAAEDDRCSLSRFPIQGSPIRRQCSLRLDDVLRTMADLGGLYPEAVELLQQAHRCQCLTCRVACDALPQATTVYDLLDAGRNGLEEAESGSALVPGDQDLGSTPTLYQRTGGRSRTPRKEHEADKPSGDTAALER